MEIEVTQEKLSRALNNVSRVAIGRVTLPVLNNVLIRVDKKKVSLTTTNLDMAVIDFLPTSNSKDGTVTVPAKLLADFVSNLPKGETIKISASDTKVTISAGRYSSTINGALADDFPELPELDEKKAATFKINIDDFKAGVSEVIIASSNDLTRPALTGVFFNTFEGALYIAATDGYRLADRKFVNDVKSEVKAIIPTAALREVLSSLSDSMENVEILVTDEQIRFRMGEVEITSKLIDASFPDYRQLIPKDSKATLILDKAEVIRMTKVAALFARESGGSVVCEAKAEAGTFSIYAVASEIGENSSDIEVEVPEDGKVVLNSRYLLDAINATTENKISFSFSGKLAPVVIKNEKSDEYTHIIMPLKS